MVRLKTNFASLCMLSNQQLYQLSSLFWKKAQQNAQDVRTLAGANTGIFGANSWQYVNQLVNELNTSLYQLSQGAKLAGQSLNFQTVIRYPSTQTGFAGSLKSLFLVSSKLWSYVSNKRPKPYTVDEAKAIINDLSNLINSSQFPEPSAQAVKPKLINILNAWGAILE